MSSLDKYKYKYKYKCEGQMDLFDYIEPNTTSFCWDKDSGKSGEPSR